MESEQIQSQKQRIGRLQKMATDTLGPGIWGLEIKNRFSHEEILFLFSQVYRALGFASVRSIRTTYPDCICMKDGKEVTIEFEPLLSGVKAHVKDGLSKCNYVVCWEDDLGDHDPIREAIREHSIDVIQLRTYYEEGKIKHRKTCLEWSSRDMQKFSEQKIKLLKAFIARKKEILTNDEISQSTSFKGNSLGGVLRSFSQHKEWLIRPHGKGKWQFNEKYRQMVRKVINQIGSEVQVTTEGDGSKSEG